MRGEQLVHTVIAVLVVAGVFTMLIISQITRVPLPAETLTILSTTLGSALGWFFGARGAAAGAQATQQALNTTAQALADSATLETHSAPLVVEGAHPPATPKE